MADYRQGKITQERFNAVKICLESGNTISGTARFMKMSDVTVRLIRDSETYEEYKHNAYEFTVKYKTKELDRKQVAAIKAKEKEQEPVASETPVRAYVNPTVVKVEATHYMMQELQRTNELLALISNKLAFIVDELCGVPNQK